MRKVFVVSLILIVSSVFTIFLQTCTRKPKKVGIFERPQNYLLPMVQKKMMVSWSEDKSAPAGLRSTRCWS